MSLESPLGRVRGLGTAKEGTGHFWHQRLTAIALIPLTFLFVVIVFAFIGADHADAVVLMGNPLVATVMLLFLIAGFYHMKLGMQVVIEDYISHEGVKIAALADIYEVNVAPHNFCGHLATMMNAHFAAVVPNLRIMETDPDTVPWHDDLVTVQPRIEEGYLQLPTGPGWGTEVNEEAVRAHPPRGEQGGVAGLFNPPEADD